MHKGSDKYIIPHTKQNILNVVNKSLKPLQTLTSLFPGAFSEEHITSSSLLLDSRSLWDACLAFLALAFTLFILGIFSTPPPTQESVDKAAEVHSCRCLYVNTRSAVTGQKCCHLLAFDNTTGAKAVCVATRYHISFKNTKKHKNWAKN